MRVCMCHASGWYRWPAVKTKTVGAGHNEACVSITYRYLIFRVSNNHVCCILSVLTRSMSVFQHRNAPAFGIVMLLDMDTAGAILI